MASGKRLLALLVLLACMIQLYECFKLASFGKKKTADEKEEEDREKEARKAYKKLFVWSGKLSHEEVMNGIEALRNFQDQFQFDFNINIDELLKIQVPNNKSCDDEQYMSRLLDLTKITKRRYKALKDWTREALQKQVEVCNYGQSFEEKLEHWKLNHPEQWNLVYNFNLFAGHHGVRMYDWKDKFLDNTPQMNEALIDLFESKRHENNQGDKATYNGYSMAQHLRDACKSFSDALGVALLMNTYNPLIKQDKGKLEWLSYLNVCKQVQRVDFRQAVEAMFSRTGYLPGQELWDSYMEYRNLWV